MALYVACRRNSRPYKASIRSRRGPLSHFTGAGAVAEQRHATRCPECGCTPKADGDGESLRVKGDVAEQVTTRDTLGDSSGASSLRQPLDAGIRSPPPEDYDMTRLPS